MCAAFTLSDSSCTSTISWLVPSPCAVLLCLCRICPPRTVGPLLFMILTYAQFYYWLVSGKFASGAIADENVGDFQCS